MVLPKFIITMDGNLRLGMVNQHKDLQIGDDSCIGGGEYLIFTHCHLFQSAA